MNRFSDDLEILWTQQKNWFIKLIKLADDDWEKTRQHKFISDMQRYAAKAVGLERPWIIKPMMLEDNKVIKCLACQSPISPLAIVCPNCKFILDKEKFESLQF